MTYRLGDGLLSAGWQSDFGRDIERPRNNSQSVRFFYPTEDSHRFTLGYELRELAGFSRVMLTAFAGRYAQVTDQERRPTATTPRSIERADISANDFQVRGSAERTIGPGRFEAGIDVNGRHGLRALDIFESFDLTGALTDRSTNVSVAAARRVDTGAYASLETPITPLLALAGGLRGDYVITRNRAGFFGDRSTAHGAGSGFASLTAGSFRGVSATLQLARGFRDPVLSDRYFRGPSGRGFITGNPDLVAGVEPPDRCGGALHRPAPARRDVRLSLPHRRAHRTLRDRRGFVPLPQPRPGAPARFRVRAAEQSRSGACRSSRRSR